MRFKGGETAKEIASIVSEEHNVPYREVEQCLLRRCLREVAKTMEEKRDNPCYPAGMGRKARAACSSLRAELREEHSALCEKQCKGYVKQGTELTQKDCIANCLFFKSTRDERYESCVEQQRFRQAASCAVENHWYTLAKCMTARCELAVPPPGKPNRPQMDMR